MGIPVYTALCQVPNRQMANWIQAVAQRVEQAPGELPPFRVPGFEPLGSRFYKKRRGAYRLLARLEPIEIDRKAVPVLVLLTYVHRQAPEYAGGSSETLEQLYGPHIREARSEIIQWLQTQPTPPTRQRLPALPGELYQLLHPIAAGEKEATLYISSVWLEAISRIKGSVLPAAVFRKVQEIVCDGSYPHKFLQQEAKQVTIFYTMVRDPVVAELHHCFLLGLTCSDWPTEDQTTFRQRSKELFEDLANHVFIPDGQQRDPERFVDEISRRAQRACPTYLLADDTLWQEVHAQRETFLALSVEEAAFLRQLLAAERLPCVVEGRAGSGKSTLLGYYTACRLVPPHAANAPPTRPQLLYLSENATLIERAKQLVDKLTRWRQRELGALDLQLEPVYQNFHQFALARLPGQQRYRFEERTPQGGWINFDRFRELFHGRGEGALRIQLPAELNAELAWFVIRSYIKGFNVDAESEAERWLSPEDYQHEVPQRDHQVSVGVYRQVWKHIWPWYKRLTVASSENDYSPPYWDDLDLAWAVLDSARPDAPRYAVILCDEVQDFSRVELAVIFGSMVWNQYDLSELPQLRLPVILAGDAHQTVNPTCFRWARVRGDAARALVSHLPHMAVPAVDSLELTYNYRNAHAIALLCNAVQALRQETLGVEGELQKPWQMADRLPNQRVRRLLITPQSQKLVEQLHEGSVWLVAPETADPENESARQFWEQLGFRLTRRQANVDTPVTVKGLEQEFVAVIGFGELFHRLDIRTFWEWKNAAESQEVSEEDRFAIEYFLNRLYVAVTRAREQLWIIDTQRGWEAFWQKFFDWLKGRRSKTVDFCYTDGNLGELIDIAQQRWADLAEESERLAHEQRNAKHAERAAFYYMQLGDRAQATKMTAYNLYYQGKLVEAADTLLELDDKDRAASWYWEAQAWEKLVRCDAPPPWRHRLARLLAEPKQNRDVKWVDRMRQLLRTEDVTRQLDLGRFARIWRSVLLDYAHHVAACADQLDQQVLKETYTLLQHYHTLLADSPRTPTGKRWYRTLAVLAFRLERWAEAAQHWEVVEDTRHLDYFRAKARSSRYPETLRWLESAGQWDQIVQLYEQHRDEVPLEQEDLIRVARAYEDRQQWLPALSLVCGTHPERTRHYWEKVVRDRELLRHVQPRQIVARMFDAQSRLDETTRNRRWTDLVFDLVLQTEPDDAIQRPWFEALVAGLGYGCDPDALVHRLAGSKRATLEGHSEKWSGFAHKLCQIAGQIQHLVPQAIQRGAWEEAYRLTWFLMLLLWRLERRTENLDAGEQSDAPRVVAVWRDYVKHTDEQRVCYPLLRIDPKVRPAVEAALACVAEAPDDWLRNADFQMLGFVRELADLVDAIAAEFLDDLKLCRGAAPTPEAAGNARWWLLAGKVAEQAPFRVRAIWIYRDSLKLGKQFGWPQAELDQVQRRLTQYSRRYEQWRAGDREERPIDVKPGRDGRSDHLLVSCIAEKSAVLEFLADRVQVRFLVPAEKAAEPRLRFHDDEVSVVGPEWIEPEFRWMVQHPLQVIRLFWHPDKRRLTVVADRRFVVDFPPAARTE